MRVVFDTNIYISAFAIPGGQAEDAYLKAIQGEFELFASVPILTETASVLQRKFDWHEDRARAVVQAIAHVATIVTGMTGLTVVKDERTTAFSSAQSLRKHTSSSQAIDISYS